MSATLSEATGRPYGIQRVCQAWERSRAALYARQTREQQRHKGEEPARRGPTPTVSDATLLEALQADLDRSPVQGEGHRKVHARLRILDGIRVARTRVLRVLRAHKLLSPHRGRQGAARVHAGTIVTQAPNVMWGTDGGRVFTLDDGWGWIFTAVEHWNAECVGLRRSSRSPRDSGASMAPSTPTALAGWRCGWTTAASTCPTTFSTRSGIGAFGPATALSRNRKRTAWRSGGIARSRSKRSTGASSRTSKEVRAAVTA